MGKLSQRKVVVLGARFGELDIKKELRRKACAEVIRVLRGKQPKILVNRELLR